MSLEDDLMEKLNTTEEKLERWKEKYQEARDVLNDIFSDIDKEDHDVFPLANILNEVDDYCENKDKDELKSLIIYQLGFVMGSVLGIQQSKKKSFEFMTYLSKNYPELIREDISKEDIVFSGDEESKDTDDSMAYA